MMCPNCKNRIPDDEETCPFCGASLKGGTQTGNSAPSPNPQPSQPNGGTNQSDPYANWGNPAPKASGGGQPPKKKSRVPLIIGIVAVVAILIGVVVAFVLPHGGEGNPSAGATGTVPPASGEPVDYKRDVIRAVSLSYETYSSAAKAMLPEEVRAMLQSPGHSADLSLTLDELAGIPNLTIDPSLLNSFGLRLSTDVNLDQETIAAELAASYGSADLVSLQAGLAGNTVSVCVPAVTGDTAYGLDTSVIGQWLVDDLGIDSKYSTLSIQPYVLLNQVKAAAKDLQDKYGPAVTKAAVEGAISSLWDAVQVELLEGENKTVGSAACTGYTVTIPEKALEELADTLYNLPYPVLEDLSGPLSDIVHSLGLPQDVLDQFDTQLSDALAANSSEQAAAAKAESLQQAKTFLQKLGDITVQVWIGSEDGLVRELDWTDTVEATTLDCTVALGTGERYVDDLAITVKVSYKAPAADATSGESAGDGTQTGGSTEGVSAESDTGAPQDFNATFSLTSKGDHTAAEGVYTDETALTLTDDSTGETVASFTSSLRYEPKSAEAAAEGDTAAADPNAAETDPNNFQWSGIITASDGTSLTVSAQGEVYLSGDKVSVSNGKVSLTSGELRIAVSLDCAVMPYADRIQLGTPVMLNELTHDELQDVVNKVIGDLVEFVLQMLSVNPTVSNLLGQLGLLGY